MDFSAKEQRKREEAGDEGEEPPILGEENGKKEMETGGVSCLPAGRASDQQCGSLVGV